MCSCLTTGFIVHQKRKAAQGINIKKQHTATHIINKLSHTAHMKTEIDYLSLWFLSQLLGMAFSMTLFHHIHRTGKKYDA